MSPIVFRKSLAKHIVVLVASIGMVAASIAIMTVSDAPTRVPIGIAGLLFFGGGGAVVVRQLFDERARLVIDDQGIFDRTLKVGVIPWSEILDAEARAMSNNWFVSLRLRDAKQFIDRLGPIHQQMVKANVALGFQPLNVNLTGLDADAHAVAELIIKEATRRRQAPDEPYRD